MFARRHGVYLTRPYGIPAGANGRTLRTLRPGQSVRVAQWEQAVLFSRGRVLRVLEPGSHRLWHSGCAIRTVDTRSWVISLPTQEAPTADGIPVKVTVAGHARVSDAVAHVTATRDPEQSLYLAVQIAVREMLAGTTLDDLVTGRGSLGDRLAVAVRGIEQIGATIEQLMIKDIMLPGELKKAQAEVLIARAQGAAALERARGETAALRSLVNAARLAAENPALLQLRLLEQLGTSAGHTVIIGTPPAPIT